MFRHIVFLLSVLMLLVSVITGAPLKSYASAEPASCQDIHNADSSAADGDYNLVLQNISISIYCYGMATDSPKEYINLVNQGGNYNFSTYAPGGATSGTGVKTNFAKLRLDPQTLKVNTGDYTFLTDTDINTGFMDHGWHRTVMPYGVAMNCGGNAGTANIDLSGTGFFVAGKFQASGWDQWGNAAFSSNNQIVDIQGGGYCGYESPSVSDDTGGWYIQLGVASTSNTIVGNVDQLANINGWYNHDVTVHFTCLDAMGTDAVSGCTNDTSVSSEGFNQSVPGTANHASDLVDSIVVSGISIDKTPPAGSVSQVSFDTGTSTVTLAANASDAVSGMDQIGFSSNGTDWSWQPAL